MKEFLTFERFIAQDVLIVIYYFLALVMPVVLWSMRFYILKKVSFLDRVNAQAQEVFFALRLRQKVLIVLFFIMLFFCMELCLRMMFEMMIGYFDMHNYLQSIARHIS